MKLKIINSNAKENTHQQLNAKKTNANPHAKEKQSTMNPRKDPRPTEAPRAPYRTASPETTTQCFTTCQFTLNSAMLTHNSPQKNISLLFFKSHAHAQCISTLVNNSKISHYSQ